MIRRGGALPETSTVAAVHVHVATERLRGPELSTAEGARVGARRPHAAGTKVSRRVPRERLLLPGRFSRGRRRRARRSCGAGAPHTPVVVGSHGSAS
jgi:hypothetical protein